MAAVISAIPADAVGAAGAADAAQEPRTKRARHEATHRGTADARPPVTHRSHRSRAARVFVLGDGGSGQLGLGAGVAQRRRPALVEAIGPCLQVACGGLHTVALTDDRKVRARRLWHGRRRGRPLSAGRASIAQVYTWGVNDEGALGRDGDEEQPKAVVFPVAGARIVLVSAGDSHSAALSDDGVVYAWGTFRDAGGRIGFSEGVDIQRNPQAVYAAASGDRAVKVASGAHHLVILTQNGAAWTLGAGDMGQLGRVGARLADRSRLRTLLQPQSVPLRLGSRRAVLVDVFCGAYHTFFVDSTGMVFACGLNNYHQLALPHHDRPRYAPERVRQLDRAVLGDDIVQVRRGHGWAEGSVCARAAPRAAALTQLACRSRAASTTPWY